jgi:hypothetical protein
MHGSRTLTRFNEAEGTNNCFLPLGRGIVVALFIDVGSTITAGLNRNLVSQIVRTYRCFPRL